MNLHKILSLLLVLVLCLAVTACSTTSKAPTKPPHVCDGDHDHDPMPGDGDNTTPGDGGNDDTTPGDDEDSDAFPDNGGDNDTPTIPDAFTVLVPDETCLIGDYFTTTYKVSNSANFIESVGKIATFNRDCLGYWKDNRDGTFKVRAKEGTLDKLKQIAVELGPRAHVNAVGPYDGAEN